MKRAVCWSIVALVVATGAMAVRADEKAGKDIVDTAVGAGKFNTLAKALAAAELVEVLKGDGPFTVFAPTDDAFAKLPTGTIEALLNDKQKLAKVLKYHVVSGKVMAKDAIALDGKSAKTVQGGSLPIKVSGGKVMIGKATVVKPDIACRNGVIHVIDMVLIPE